MRGFTLLEILIALFIFAIASTMMVTALHNIMNNQSRVEQRSKAFADIQLALLALSQDMEQIVNRPITNSQGMQEPAFIGNSDNVMFTHAGLSNPTQQHRSTLQRTQYRYEQGKLFRDTWAVLDQAPQSQPIKKLLLSNIADLRFTYFDHQGIFQKQWPPADDSNQKDNKQKQPLPHAIQVIITIKKWGKLSQVYFIPAQMPEQQPQSQQNPQGQQNAPENQNSKK